MGAVLWKVERLQYFRLVGGAQVNRGWLHAIAGNEPIAVRNASAAVAPAWPRWGPAQAAFACDSLGYGPSSFMYTDVDGVQPLAGARDSLVGTDCECPCGDTGCIDCFVRQSLRALRGPLHPRALRGASARRDRALLSISAANWTSAQASSCSSAFVGLQRAGPNAPGTPVGLACASSTPALDGAVFFECSSPGSSTCLGGRLVVVINGARYLVAASSISGRAMSVICRERGFGPPTTNDEDFVDSSWSGCVRMVKLVCFGHEASTAECFRRVEVSCTAAQGWCLPAIFKNRDLELVGGTGYGSGVLTLFHGGKWRRVCSAEWAPNDAAVVCSSLGYGRAAPLVLPAPSIGMAYEGAVTFEDSAGYASSVGCAGTEVTVSECADFPDAWEVLPECPAEDAEPRAVVCAPRAGGVPAAGTVRIESQPTVWHAGRVEVWHGNQWFAVCADTASASVASMACQAAGFAGTAPQPWPNMSALATGHSRPYLFSQTDCPTGARADASLPGAFLQCGAAAGGPLSAASQTPSSVCPSGEALVVSCDPSIPFAVCDKDSVAVSTSGVVVDSTDSPTSIFGQDEGNTASGYVQVRVESISGIPPVGSSVTLPMCGINFSLEIATVVCREQGFHAPILSGSWARPAFPWPMDSIVAVRQFHALGDIQCTGAEARVSDCSFQAVVTMKCESGNEAFVTCSRDPLTSENVTALRIADVRLTGSGSSASGRLEVRITGQTDFHGVSSSGFGWAEANVSCRHLGFQGGAMLRESYALPPEISSGLLGIAVESLSCAHSPNATDMNECSRAPFFTFASLSRQSVFVECVSLPLGNDVVANTTSRDLTMITGSSTIAGSLVVKSEDIWGYVCGGDGFTHREATVACRSMGFLGAANLDSFAVGDVLFGDELVDSLALPETVWDVRCVGTETRLLACAHTLATSSQGCTHVGLICIPTERVASPDDAEEGTIAIVGNPAGDDSMMGRVEVRFAGEWRPLCAPSLSVWDAHVVCRELGFARAEDTGEFTVTALSLGAAATEPFAGEIECGGTEESLLLCAMSRSAAARGCRPSEQLAVRCVAPSDSRIAVISGIVAGIVAMGVVIGYIWRRLAKRRLEDHRRKAIKDKAMAGGDGTLVAFSADQMAARWREAPTTAAARDLSNTSRTTRGVTTAGPVVINPTPLQPAASSLRAHVYQPSTGSGAHDSSLPPAAPARGRAGGVPPTGADALPKPSYLQYQPWSMQPPPGANLPSAAGGAPPDVPMPPVPWSANMDPTNPTPGN